MVQNVAIALIGCVNGTATRGPIFGVTSFMDDPLQLKFACLALSDTDTLRLLNFPPQGCAHLKSQSLVQLMGRVEVP